MKYGLTEEEIKELNKQGFLYDYGGVLCLVCYQEVTDDYELSPDIYFGAILSSHLKRKHPEEFGELEHPIKHYRELYPGARIQAKEVTEKIRLGGDPVAQYKEISLDKIKREIVKAGGIGKYSQDQLLLIHKKLLKLADIYEQNGEFDKMESALEKAQKAISNTSPARSKIDSQKDIKKATQKDEQAIEELKSMKEQLLKDMQITEGGKLKEAWEDSEI